MKILMLNTHDQEGGAARATFRFHQKLRDAGVESTLFVQARSSIDSSVISPTDKIDKFLSILRPTIDQLPLSLFGKTNYPFSTAWFPISQVPRQLYENTDLIHLNWINKGFIGIESIRRIKKPLVWTLHDMWPLTGGCHYAMDCESYQSKCGSCPQLAKNHPHDLSRWIWQWKSRAWRHVPITLVCPSQWMASNVKKSALFGNNHVEVLANGLDLDLFSPGDRFVARKRLGLPEKKTLILFSSINASVNPFKGFGFLEGLITQLVNQDWKDGLELVIMGSSGDPEKYRFKIPVHFLGEFKDELSISFVYNAVDLFLAPSVIDNLPNTIIEALGCGIPCAAFNVGGISDQIRTGFNGYLAQPFNIPEMAFGIKEIFKDQETWTRFSINARKTAEKYFDIQKQTRQLINLYEKIITTHQEAS